MDVYLLPGLGADHRLFQRLRLPGHTPLPLDWPEMPPGSGLRDFAKRLARRVRKDRPHALVGVSMGGMVVQEMAALTHPGKVVIISSWKGPQEMPMSIRLLRGTHPERVITKSFVQRMAPFVKWQMSVQDKKSDMLFDELFRVHSAAQLRVQVNAVLEWQGPEVPVEHIVHIHGDSDRLMPLATIKGALVVKGGGHFMVFDHADEVGKRVLKALAAG